MAQMSTSLGLAKQPAMGFGRALLAAIVVLAISVGLVAATSFVATTNRAVGVPIAHHALDQIAPTTAFPLPRSAYPASARDYRSATKPEIAPTTPVLADGARGK